MFKIELLMRITTLVKNYLSYFVLLLSLLCYNNAVYSQCPTVTNANQSFCDIQSPTIASLVATDNGGGIKWYANSSGGSALSNSTSLTNGEDYFVDDNTGNCGVRQSVIVTIYSAPTGANFQGVCVTSQSQATPSNPQFVISGNNLQWYTTSTGGTPISNLTVLNDNTIYYISQTNPDTGCQTTRLQLFVNVGVVPVPTGNPVQEFCSVASPTINDLVASGNNNWYLTPTFGIPLDPSTPLVNGQHYYATTVDPPCESTDRFDVLVNIYEPNDAGNDGNRGICLDQVSSTSPFDLFNFLGGTPDNTGVWTGPVTTTNGFQGTLDVSTMTLAGSPYVFTYTVSSALCATDTATVTITINPVPTVTVTSAPVCAGTPATVTAIPNPAGTYTYVWTVPSGVADPGNVPTFSTLTAGVYSVVITDTTTICPSLSGQTTVVINPLPNAGTAVTTPSFCTSVGTVNLDTLLTGQDAGGTWSVASPVTVSAFAAGTYTYTYTVTNTCGTDTEDVQFIILPNPVVATSNITISPVCIGLDVTVNLTGMVDGTYTLNYDLSGSNILVNQTVNVVISGGNGSFTIPTANVPNAGSTTITFNTIQDTTNTCQVALSNVSVTIVINPIVQIDNTNIAVSSICLGSVATVVISNAINLPDGTYQFNYSIPTGTPTAGNSGDVTITGGNGQFTVPASVFATVGSYTITINSITTTTGCSNTTENANITFNVVAPLTAGTAVTTPSFCTSVGTVNLDTLLTGQDAGGTWSVASPVTVGAFAAGTYTYTYTVTNTCGTDTEDVQFIILPNPVVATSNITISPVCIGLDVTVNLSGMVDGTYTLNYDLSGSNTLANQNSTVVISGSNGSFTIPTANVPNAGTTTITFNTIQNTTTTCQVTLNNVSGTIVINPIVQIDNTNIAVSTICIGSVATVVISNATNLPDGVYQFNYSIPTGTPTIGNSGDVTITGGSGQFTVPASVFATVGNYTITISSITTTTGCSNAIEDANTTFAVVAPLSAGTFTGITSVCPSTGIIDLAALLNGESAGGVWTDGTSQVVTSPINIISFPAGTYSYTYTVTNACGSDTEVVQFTVYANPQLTTLNVSTSPTCIGTNALVNLNGMVDGTYTLNYNLSGSNTLAGQSVVVTIAGTIGNFTIPTASIPNVGTTVITFTSIVNNTTTCTNTIINVAAQIIIQPLADIDNANLSITNVCFGNNVVVNITSAINLPDGVYQFNYSIPRATPVAGNSGNVTITSGVGQFTIPSTTFTIAGNYTLTVTGIIAATGCTNTTENATANFIINPIPSIAGATISAQATCPNFGSLVTISGASSFDGTYSITYQLAGANTATGTVLVTFTSGVATFTIPSTDLTNAGDTTITINQLISGATICGITGNILGPITFTVTALATPVLITDGNLFCGIANPTIANLSANVVGTSTVIWYNAPTGGTAYNNTDVLVDGTIYYGVSVGISGCESAVRLVVKITICTDVVIPDGFSPNNDGINDTFEIPNLAILFPNFKLEIYNRYGSLVYTGNINKANWGGTTTESGLNLGDKLLPTGVYFYILDFKDGTKKAIQGRVYLNR